MSKISKSALYATLPPEPVVTMEHSSAKIAVLDDDPTGTQTVHGVYILADWSIAALEAELREKAPCFYVLTNSRALPVAGACAVNSEIGRNLSLAAERTGVAFDVISRSDSTLRGHFPAETDTLAGALGGTIDGVLIIPAFLAGGRMTIGDIHYVADGDTLTPAGETEFARDPCFGYAASNLRDWVAEKTSGRIPAASVQSISIRDLRQGGSDRVAAFLQVLPRGGVTIVNIASRGDLAVLTHALAATTRMGRRFLFRTAGDFVAAFAGIEPSPLLSADFLRAPSTATGGLVVAGSHVAKSSAQLDALFAGCPAVARLEVFVDRLLTPASRRSEIRRCIEAIDTQIAEGTSVVLYTSRTLIMAEEMRENLAIGESVSSGLVEIVRALHARPRWLVVKGGITSSDIATKALGIRRALVLGQALPGVPVWRGGPESKWPGLAYIVFPGNVGSPFSLCQLVQALDAE